MSKPKRCSLSDGLVILRVLKLEAENGFLGAKNPPLFLKKGGEKIFSFFKISQESFSLSLHRIGRLSQKEEKFMLAPLHLDAPSMDLSSLSLYCTDSTPSEWFSVEGDLDDFIYYGESSKEASER